MKGQECMNLLAWLNSIQVRMVGFALGVILVVTAVSIAIVQLSGPARTPVSIYDLGKVMRGVKPAQSDLAVQFERRAVTDMPDDQSPIEARLARLLAMELGTSPDNVRFRLGNRSDTYFSYVGRQLDSYDRDGRASPILSGGITAAWRHSDGRWEVFERASRPGMRDGWQLLRASPWFGAVLVIPLGLWFGTLLARPVRTFARAARRAGDGRTELPVPVTGPTEIRIAAEAVNEMQARIREYMRERTTLVAAIAHDLRTPLNNLRFRLATAPPAIRDPAEGDVEQLEALINAILDYVESDRKELTVELVDLTSLVQSIIDDMPATSRIEMNEVGEVKIEGDILLLRRLFSNLIANGAKFATKVEVHLRSEERQAVVEIVDNGPGMSPSDLSLAFEPFFRGERSRNRSRGGVGLGLAIVKSAVEAHGGEVTLTNRPEGGMIARVSLKNRHASAAET
jgi:two-component system OmpR family sensor kinase